MSRVLPDLTVAAVGSGSVRSALPPGECSVELPECGEGAGASLRIPLYIIIAATSGCGLVVFIDDYGNPVDIVKSLITEGITYQVESVYGAVLSGLFCALSLLVFIFTIATIVGIVHEARSR